MKSIPGKALCRIVERKGWVLQRVTGSHHVYKKADVNKILSIPVHKSKDLKIGTIRALMAIAELTEADLE